MAYPSKPSARVASALSPRRSGNIPPCTIPNCAWPGLLTFTSCGRRAPKQFDAAAAAFRPAHRSLHRGGGAFARGRIGEALVEHHGDVGPEPGLDIHRHLRSQEMTRAIEVRSELDSVLGDAPALGQAEYLVSAAVGQDRTVPGGEAVKTARRAMRSSPGRRCR